MKDVVAGIVTYNPDISRLTENILAIAPQVGSVYIVDNGSNNIEAIRKIKNSVPNLEIKELGTNYGIAKALNEIFIYFKDDADWVLTLDQDSVVSEYYIESFIPYLSEQGYVSLCPKIKLRIDSNTSHEYSENLTEVPKCITSGNLVRVSAWEEVGRFNEDLFIDMVDFEFCYRLHQYGHKVYQINSAIIFHELGNPEYRRFLWRKVCVYNHNAFRKYYIARNSMYLLKMYPKEADLPFVRVFLLKNILFIVLYEEDKFNKLRRVLAGVKDCSKLISKGKDK